LGRFFFEKFSFMLYFYKLTAILIFMEAIIKAKDIKTFQAVIDFLKSLNFDVTITDQAISKSSLKEKDFRKK